MPTKKELKKMSLLKGLILGFLFLLFFFILRWNSFTTPFERDEGEYAYSAWILRQGTLPYQNSFLQKPPMIVYSYALSQVVFGDNLWGPRLLASIFILLTSVFVYKVAEQKIGKNAGWMSLFIFVTMVSSPINASLAANTEVFMILPLMAFYYLYNQENLKRKHLSWTLAGVLSSLSLWYKPICLFILGFIYVLWLARIYRNNRKEAFYFIGYNLLGFVVSSLVVFLPFLGIIKYLWGEVIIFNSLYAKYWGVSFGFLWLNLKRMWRSFWIVYLLLVAYFLLRPKGWKEFLGIFVFCMLVVFQTSIRHYYILLIPFMSIMCVSVISCLSEKFLSNRNKYLMLLGFLLIFIFPVRVGITLSPQDLSYWIYGLGNPFVESVQMAQKVKEITNEDDTIFVAGSEPQIYYYAKRKSSNRFVITYPFIIKTGLRPHYQNEAVGAFERSLPKAIVYSNLEESGFWNNTSPTTLRDYMDSLLKEKYKVVGGFVRERSGIFWRDDLTKYRGEDVSLILYIRK